MRRVRIVTIQEESASVNVGELQLSGEEYNIIVTIMRWLKGTEHGEMTVKKHGGDVYIFVTDKSKFDLDKKEGE